jgi:hypothetical protein
MSYLTGLAKLAGWKFKDGAGYVTQATLLSGEDQANDVIKTESRFQYKHITTAMTTDVSSTGAFLHAVVINGGATGAVTIRDDTTGGVSSPIAVITIVGTYTYNCDMPNGIQVVTTAATDVTVIYRVNV